MSENNFTIHNVRLESHFTITCNYTPADENLTFGAKGLLWYILSRPKDWKIKTYQLAQLYTGTKKGAGLDAVNGFIKELKENGYIQYSKCKNKLGQWEHRYDVFPMPIKIFQKMFPEPVYPGMGYPVMDNPPILTSNELPSSVVVVGDTPPSSENDKNKAAKETEKKQECNKRTEMPLKPSISFSKDDLYFMANKSRKDWDACEIEAAWIVYMNSDPNLISDPFAYIRGIINKTRVKQVAQKEKDLQKFKNTKLKEEEKCKHHQEKTQKATRNTSNDFIAEKDMSESPLAKFARQNGLK